MEFIINRQILLNELQLIKGVIEKKNTMPILSNILIEAEHNQLILKSTDLDVGFICQCPAQVIEPGTFTIDAMKIQEILSYCSDRQMQFSMNEGTLLNINTAEGNIQFDDIETMNVNDYPTIPQYDFSEAFSINASFFSECINLVLFSISSEAHKYALNGCFFQIKDGLMEMVSTDTHRMSALKTPVSDEDFEIKLLIPRKTILELKKMIASAAEDERLDIGFFENRLFFRFSGRILFSRVIDGTFPEYEKAIPLNNDKVFQFDRKQLLEIMRRKLIFLSDKSKLVRIQFSKNQMNVSLVNSQRGASKDRVAIEYNEEPFEVGYNVSYFYDFLKNMTCDTIEMYVKQTGSQGLFRIVKDELPYDYKHVIMPMRING
jgi:DNA polymerase-3 subunit beta